MKKLLMALMGFLGISGASADNTLNFDTIDSREKAVKLAKEGKLFKVLLFPAEFGGEDTPHNVVFVPAGIPEIKEQITGTLVRFVQEGLIDNLKVTPEYKGKSFIPSKIHMQTSHSGKDGEFNPSIEVW